MAGKGDLPESKMLFTNSVVNSKFAGDFVNGNTHSIVHKFTNFFTIVNIVCEQIIH